jgi:hypothetical protein
MKFESKAHMAQELINGKRFTNNGEFVIYYDPTHVNPFRCNSDEMSHIWDTYYLDIWAEDNPQHVHQDLYRHLYYCFNEANEHLKNNGLCYPCTEEGKSAAILHAKAMLKVN